MISFNKVNEIIKTLPVGYYLGRKIDVSLENTECSYFDSFNHQIVVSYSQLPCARYDYEIKDDEIENEVRCMLYHEISHAIASPEIRLFKIAYSDTCGWSMVDYDYLRLKNMSEEKFLNIMNIFEDEYIETVFRSYFLRVNFKEFVKKVNGYKGPSIPKNPLEAFYYIVRFNDGPEELIEEVYNIINCRLKYLSPTSGCDMNNFASRVMKLYFKVEDMFKKDDPPKEKELTIKDYDGSTKSKDRGPLLEEKLKAFTEVDLGSAETIKSIIKQIMINSRTFKRDLFSKIDYKEEGVEKLKSKIENIIINVRRKKGLTASSYNTYIGKINPKLIGKKHIEDYRWFDKSLNGDKNKSSKIQLNLFIDVSSSFMNSEDDMNILLTALNDLQKKYKDFTVRLVTHGNKNEIHAKLEKVNMTDGNCLTNEVIELYKKVQNRSATNYNIVVFDGFAQTFDNCYPDYTKRIQLQEENKKAWSAWNHPNCVIVSDYSNQEYFDKYSPNAKKIYTSDYFHNFEKNILTALRNLFK